MYRDFFDPLPDQIRVIAVGAASLHRAEQMVLSCEHCHPDDAEIPFDWALAEVTGKRGPIVSC